MEVYIQTFLRSGILTLWYFDARTITTTSFHARNVDVCLFQVVISHCCCKLIHTDICQCLIKSSYMR